MIPSKKKMLKQWCDPVHFNLLGYRTENWQPICDIEERITAMTVLSYVLQELWRC